MKSKILTVCIGFLALASFSFAGERMAIKKFDERGLIELNNLLARQDKLIRKLLKQTKTGSITSGTEQSKGTTDLVPETVLEGIEQVPAYGITREDGRVELYDVSGDNDDDISPTKDAYIYETQAKIAVPSSYFLDLRGIYLSTSTQRYTADVAVLHDVNGDTITLTNLDETNNIGTAGPIAGGRDQSAAFNANSWVHFFFIYNPILKDVSILSSASPTAPTLPAGYTHFVRAGCVFVQSSVLIVRSYQINDKVVYDPRYPKWDSHGALSSIDLSLYIPPTAKLVHGVFGLSSAVSAKSMYVAADNGPWIKVTAMCDASGSPTTGTGPSGSKDFTLPILTSQTIYWYTETTGDIYAVGITGFTDDL